MRATRHLGRLNSAVAGRLSRLRQIHTAVLGLGGPRSLPDVSYLAIELDNLIMAAMRQFMISTLTGARTASGQKITSIPSFSDEGEVAAYALSVLSPVGYGKLGSPQRLSRRDEFKIREPRSVEKVVASCAASNLISVQAAYAYNTGVFTYLPTIRNFYAHRNDDTWRKVKNVAGGVGVYGIKYPDQLLLTQLSNRPVTVFEDWCDDVELFFYQLTL